MRRGDAKMAQEAQVGARSTVSFSRMIYNTDWDLCTAKFAEKEDKGSPTEGSINGMPEPFAQIVS